MTTADRLRWSDMRAKLTQGIRLPPDEFVWFCRMRKAVEGYNKASLDKLCHKPKGRKK